jgi:hypothetical protein
MRVGLHVHKIVTVTSTVPVSRIPGGSEFDLKTHIFYLMG